jgi:hypothetical protein
MACYRGSFTLFLLLLIRTQDQIFKVIEHPTLTYGNENWALNRSKRRAIEAAEVFFLRHLSRYLLTDQVRNTIRRNELQIYALQERIQYEKHRLHN